MAKPTSEQLRLAEENHVLARFRSARDAPCPDVDIRLIIRAGRLVAVKLELADDVSYLKAMWGGNGHGTAFGG